MFSPLAFPNGAIFYDLVTHLPPPSHLALCPFDLYREPLAVIAIADGEELEHVVFSKRQSASQAPTKTEGNIRALYQDLEDLRDAYPKMLSHQVLIFDYTPPPEGEVPVPEGITVIPPVEQSTITTMKTAMCDISSLLLAEMNTLAKSFEGMSSIDSPGQAPSRPTTNGSWTSDDTNPMARRNSQFAPNITRSSSTSSAVERKEARMSMPIPFKSLPFGSSNSTPGTRSSTPARSGLSNPPTTFDDMASTNGSNTDASEESAPSENTKSNRISVQGFGPGGLNEKWRNKGKARSTILVGSLYLQAGRWSDALRELADGATVAKSMNDHLWHGKALELIVLSLFLLGWSGNEFQIPMICYPPNEKAPNSAKKGQDVEKDDAEQPRCLRNLQIILPELFERIVGLYSRMTGEQLPSLGLSDAIIRFCNTLAILHIHDGRLDKKTLGIMVTGKLSAPPLTTSPRLSITPSRTMITNFLFKALPSYAPELLTTVDRALILSGIASVLGHLGFHRKKAMIVRELISVLIAGLVEARTRGAADVGIHPAAGLVALSTVNGHTNGAGALELGEGDIEDGIEAFLGLLCKTYGVVSINGLARDPAKDASISDADADVVVRIRNQAAVRNFGFHNTKTDILRACIHFSEALPDFNGVLKFSSDLLRTAGSGIAPGARGEDAAPLISREEQVRLANNISKTSDLAQRLGLQHLSAEYWDEFLIRGVTLDPLPPTRTPTRHSRSLLPGVATARSSQDVNPFIYNPFSRTPEKVAVERTLVAGEAACFRFTLQNPYDIDIDIESIKLDTEGAKFESAVQTTVVGPYRTQVLKVFGTPLEEGAVRVTGAIVRVRGCRERRFPIFSHAWGPETDLKIKGIGLGSLEKNKTLPCPGLPLEPDSIELKAISAQPIVVVKSTSLPQSSVMILEGERQVFSITLHNLSPTTPADLLLFSFQDSTLAPIQAALSNRDTTPIEMYEYELILAKKQALRLRRVDDSMRYIAPGGTATFEFEVFGKPGLTSGTVQVDYAHLGVPRSEIPEQFHTRQVCLDLTITVNASVELARADILPIQGAVSSRLWARLPPSTDADPQKSADNPEPEYFMATDDYCLLMMDLRNAWPSDMQVRLEVDEGGSGSGRSGVVVEEHILPGNTNRVIVPIPRAYVEDPHAAIPALNASRPLRQFVVSSSRVTPEAERGSREAFWYRERILGALTATWRTLTGAGAGAGSDARHGCLELRGLRLTPRMIDVVKIDEVGIEISVEGAGSGEKAAEIKGATEEDNVIHVDEFAQVRVRVTNRTERPIRPTVRLTPSLSSRRQLPAAQPPWSSPAAVTAGGGALDLARKLAWNGTLQRHLPTLPGRSATDVVVGVTALCRGEFEISASVEETVLWMPSLSELGEDEGDGDGDQDKGEGEDEGDGLVHSNREGEEEQRVEEKREEDEYEDEGEQEAKRQRDRDIRDRSDTQAMMDALLGAKERRIWHSRYPYRVSVRDPPLSEK